MSFILAFIFGFGGRYIASILGFLMVYWVKFSWDNANIWVIVRPYQAYIVSNFLGCIILGHSSSISGIYCVKSSGLHNIGSVFHGFCIILGHKSHILFQIFWAALYWVIGNIFKIFLWYIALY